LYTEGCEVSIAESICHGNVKDDYVVR